MNFEVHKRFVLICSLILIAVSLSVLLGWAADIDVFKTILPGYPEMKPVGAGGFLLLAVGLYISVQDPKDRRFRWGTTAIGCIIAVLALIVLGVYLFHFTTQIDAALVPNLDPASSGPRFSPISTLNFLLTGVSMALMRSRFKQMSGTLVVIALIATYAAILGHLYRADTFYGFSDINGMPLHTAFLFLVTGAGMLWRNRQFRLVRLMRSDSLGGAAARRLIPFVVLIPSFIGWLRVAGQDRGLYDTGFGSAMSTFVLVILILAIVLFYSQTVHSADEKRRRAESDLADKEMRYRELFDYSQGLICIHDLDGVLSTINRAAQQMLGCTEDEIVGRKLSDFMPPERRLMFEAYLRQIAHEGLAEGLLELRSKNGKPIILRYHNVLATEEGKDPYILAHAQDVTELLEAQKHLQNLSLTDELTGLYNRRGFLTLAEQQLRLERHSGTARGLTLMFADMDGLKAINDNFGHEAGSEAIRTLSTLIKSVVRSADLVARWGGDEFVILTIGSQDENAEMVLDRIEKCLKEYNEYSGKPYKIACSIGIAPVGRGNGRTFEEMIAEADRAMYADKRRRKTSADFASDAPHSSIPPMQSELPPVSTAARLLCDKADCAERHLTDPASLGEGSAFCGSDDSDCGPQTGRGEAPPVNITPYQRKHFYSSLGL